MKGAKATEWLTFEVPGLPESQGSARAFVIKGKARITSDNRKLSSWRRDAIVAIRDARTKRRLPTFDGAVYVSLFFTFPRPAGHFGAGRNAGQLRPSAPHFKANKPDIDKLVRAALDALTAAEAWRDDGQVVEVNATKEFADGDRKKVGVVGVVYELEVAPE